VVDLDLKIEMLIRTQWKMTDLFCDVLCKFFGSIDLLVDFVLNFLDGPSDKLNR
jgi:hypothetical protein